MKFEIIGHWVEIKDKATRDKALALCRGQYQRNLIMGWENLSGSTLAGKAKEYSGRYAESRANLLGRLIANGIGVKERIGKHNRRILVLF